MHVFGCNKEVWPWSLRFASESEACRISTMQPHHQPTICSSRGLNSSVTLLARWLMLTFHPSQPLAHLQASTHLRQWSFFLQHEELAKFHSSQWVAMEVRRMMTAVADDACKEETGSCEGGIVGFLEVTQHCMTWPPPLQCSAGHIFEVELCSQPPHQDRCHAAKILNSKQEQTRAYFQAFVA